MHEGASVNTHRFSWWSAVVRIMACSCLCLVGFGAEAKAGGVTHIHDGWVSYSFTIQNPNANPIHYSLGGQAYTLPAGQQVTWTGTGQLPTISFDNGHNQMIYYVLDSDRTYQFTWNQDVLDLFAQ
jgi:hypothetical protein